MQRIQTSKGTDITVCETCSKAWCDYLNSHNYMEPEGTAWMCGDCRKLNMDGKTDISPEAEKRMAYDLFGVEPEPEKYQLFAKIRPESKYHDQQRDENPFPIAIYADHGEYCFKGNSNAYRASDLYLFASVAGTFVKLSL